MDVMNVCVCDYKIIHWKEQFEISHLEAFNANLPTIDSCKLPDAGLLPHQNAAAVLDYFRQRYINGEIYVRRYDFAPICYLCVSCSVYAP